MHRAWVGNSQPQRHRSKACDALNCEACLECGQPLPPDSVAETVELMCTQLRVADGDEDVLPRLHGGQRVRRWRVKFDDGGLAQHQQGA